MRSFFPARAAGGGFGPHRRARPLRHQPPAARGAGYVRARRSAVARGTARRSVRGLPGNNGAGLVDDLSRRPGEPRVVEFPDCGRGGPVTRRPIPWSTVQRR
mgnify:CR=1 FL=1